MENNVIYAKEGKVFLNKKYGILFGDVLYIGNTVDENNQEVKDSIENYEEIDTPSDYELGKLIK